MKKWMMLTLLVTMVSVMRAQSSLEVVPAGSGTQASEQVTFGISAPSGVYPNPASGTAYLDVHTENTTKGAKLRITNLLGELIYEKAVELSKGTSVLSFEREQLAPGIYLVVLSAGTEHITRRFTVSR